MGESTRTVYPVYGLSAAGAAVPVGVGAVLIEVGTNLVAVVGP